MKKKQIQEIIAPIIISDFEYKLKIMDILSDISIDKLTTKEFLWAASNLPDGKTKGIFDTNITNIKFGKINHNAKDIYSAFNITMNELKNFALVMKESIDYMETIPEEQRANSHSIQYIVDKLGNNPKFLTTLIIKTMNDTMSELHNLDNPIKKQMADILKMINKIKDNTANKSSDDEGEFDD